MKKDEFELLLKMELDLDLNNKCYKGFYYWQYLRVGIFNRINFEINGLQSPSTNPQIGVISVLKLALKVFMNERFDIKKHLCKADCLILCDPNRKFVDNRYICSYTHYITKEIESKIEIEQPNNYIHFEPPDSDVIYIDRLFWKRALYTSLKPKCIERGSEIKNVLISINEYLVSVGVSFQFDVDKETRRIIGLFYRYKYMKKKFKSIMDIVNPKLIIEVQYYNFENMVINEICNERKVKVIELQHGVISPYHFAYNALNVLNNVTLPNYIYTFGDYWSRFVKYPIPEKNVISVGFPYFEEQKRKLSFNCNRNTILFLSQGTIGHKLALLADELSKIITEKYKIVYKLHPGEYNDYKEKYENLLNNKGIELISDQTNLYELLAKSIVMVGVSSTSIFEGLGLGVRAFLLNVEEVNHLIPLVEQGYAKLIRNADDIVRNLNGVSKDVNEDIFRPEAVKNMKREIGYLLNQE